MQRIATPLAASRHVGPAQLRSRHADMPSQPAARQNEARHLFPTGRRCPCQAVSCRHEPTGRAAPVQAGARPRASRLSASVRYQAARRAKAHLVLSRPCGSYRRFQPQHALPTHCGRPFPSSLLDAWHADGSLQGNSRRAAASRAFTLLARTPPTSPATACRRRSHQATSQRSARLYRPSPVMPTGLAAPRPLTPFRLA